MSRADLPHSFEAEESVLGGVLVHPKKFHDAAELLAPEDFFHPALKVIYEAMLACDARNAPIDALTVLEQMRSMDTADRLRAFGGDGYLTELMAKVVTVENIAFHANIVRNKALARRLITACDQIADQGRTDYGDPQDFLDESERLFSAATARRHHSPYEHVESCLKEAIRVWEKRYDHQAEVTGVPCGLTEVDGMTAGGQPGDVVLVAGRPSMGKTSYAMNGVEHAAVIHHIPGLVFSLEMSKLALTERMLAGRAGINSAAARRGAFAVDDWKRASMAASEVASAPIWIDDSAVMLNEIKAKARRWRNNPKEGGASERAQIVIDYLQLVKLPPSPDRRYIDRQREVTEISDALKSLAKELGLPIIALCQLNRSLEGRPDKRPLMSDLRESGALEQVADVIAFIYRAEVYLKDETPPEEQGIAEIIIGKQRNGPTGTVKVRFDGRTTRFSDRVRDEPPPGLFDEERDW